ncbi:MAG: Zn-ribbon domain-containing OB-fold protein [Acidimicrobiales bacterium]
MTELPTPEPEPTLETEPFWEAAAEGRLLLPRCDGCGVVIWYPRRFCPECHQRSISWFEASGRGTIYSFTVVRQAPPPWREAVPYVIAQVELDEGPRVLTNIVGCETSEVAIGREVEVVFDRSAGGRAVPRFRLRS